MAGKSYAEKIRIERSAEELFLDFIADISEKIYRNISSNGSVLFRNIYEIIIWVMPEYVPMEGDFVVYKNKILRVEGYTTDDFALKYSIKCITLDDFVRTSEGARIIPLFSQVRGQVFKFIDGDDYVSTGNHFFICHFFDENNNPVNYVFGKKFDNNSIELVMEPDTSFTGTLIIERR